MPSTADGALFSPFCFKQSVYSVSKSCLQLFQLPIFSLGVNFSPFSFVVAFFEMSSDESSLQRNLKQQLFESSVWKKNISLFAFFGTTTLWPMALCPTTLRSSLCQLSSNKSQQHFQERRESNPGRWVGSKNDASGLCIPRSKNLVSVFSKFYHPS